MTSALSPRGVVDRTSRAASRHGGYVPAATVFVRKRVRRLTGKG
jgi:hypothetical protein